MKVIKSGSDEVWWHGRNIECGVCGQVMELERGDIEFGVVTKANEHVVSVVCQNCGREFGEYKSIPFLGVPTPPGLLGTVTARGIESPAYQEPQWCPKC